MNIIDPLVRANVRLRAVWLLMASGFLALLAGLWWLQVVQRHEYQMSLETQSYRTMRIPAPRGRIYDRTGDLLADTRPSYNLHLYLEEIRPRFAAAYDELKPPVLAVLKAGEEAERQRLNRKLTTAERRPFQLRGERKATLERTARYRAVSNLLVDVSTVLGTPIKVDEDTFHRHYYARRAMPLPLITGMTPVQLARFTEAGPRWAGVDIEVQPLRTYPHGTLAAHVLGHLTLDPQSAKGEPAEFDYRLPDYRGALGIELGYDQALRGQAGAISVLVNNFGYRHEDAVWEKVQPGSDLRLTLDLEVQRAAEAALRATNNTTGRGAVVVMDVRTGDLLALASAPTFNPGYYVDGFPPGQYARLNDPEQRPLINRATQEHYAPGSIFKTVIGLAALQQGLNPHETYRVEPHPTLPNKGAIRIGRRLIKDEARPGEYDFKRALLKSSNSYFITNGLRAGIESIVALAERLHLGESTGLPTRQETRGIFPTLAQVRAGWSPGETANICIGQGAMAVTPLQMAVMTAAIANHGQVLRPRLVAEVKPHPDSPRPGLGAPVAPDVRDTLGVEPRHLQTLRDAMLADIEDPEGTGRHAAMPGLRLGGKTGTAQITDPANRVIGHTTWFISFAPYENPQVAVVIMVEGGISGGGTCAPLAPAIYRAVFPQLTQEVATTRTP
jgi:penicillin-binding protein 2